MLDILVIVGLFIVILAEFIFLLVVLEREDKDKAKLLNQLEKANAALIAKDAQSYVMMRSIDKVRDEERQESPEGVDVSELSDEEYDKMLKQSLKVGN